MYCRSGTLLRSDAGRALYGFHVPRAGYSEIFGEDNLAAVDNIETKDKRNTQAALLHGHLLQTQSLISVAYREERAHLAVANRAFDITLNPLGTRDSTIVSDKLLELSELLAQGHLLDKFVGKLDSLLLLVCCLSRC